VGILVAILTLVVLGAVMLIVSAPLWAARRAPESRSAVERADLQAAREAKYREIRDAEMDFRTGKLSREDFAAVDGALRAEAVEILGGLDALGDDDAPQGAEDAESQDGL
jgi:hypothetical protein